MKLKNHIFICAIILLAFTSYAQNSIQKKADNLFNKFSFVDAAKVYQELVDKNFNADYATRQLANSYAYMRNPDSAVVYYQKAVQQNHIPIAYYYNYAQALRGVKDYESSRIWIKRFKDEGGIIDDKTFLNDADFINSIFNAKQQYFLTDVKFNSKYSDFGAYVYNGNIYFASSRDEGVSTKHKYGWNKEPFLDIYVAESTSDTIVNHNSKLKGDVNSVYHEGPLTITKDGKTMYFSRNDFIKNTLGKDKIGSTNLKIYRATFIDGKWTNIEELPFNGRNFSNGHPALNEDDTRLFFASDRSGGFGGADLYYVDINEDGSYGNPQNLGNVVNTNKNEKFPFINSEGSLFFSSDGHHGLGLLDIFGTVSDKNKNFISIINLGKPVNSSKDDFSFFMNSDGLSGYFASNRSGGIGSDDVYAFFKIPQLKIEGTVVDAETDAPIVKTLITLQNSDGEEIAQVETDIEGYYQINIERDTDYIITTKKNNFEDHTTPVSSKNLDKSVKTIKTNFVLHQKVKEEIQKTEFYPIYFDFNKSNIRNDDTVELNRIVDLMVNKYPNMTIKIESYTDSRGPSQYNEKLSQKRAITTFNYLINNGVNPDRIIDYKGLGEEKLVNDCDGNKACTEDEHQQNRRTEFIIIKME